MRTDPNMHTDISITGSGKLRVLVPTYTCARMQVSQNSHEVLDSDLFMKQLPLCHWKVLMKLMQCAEYCFKSIADHQAIIHMYHTKKVVPFKTMNIPSCKSVTPLKYYGGLPFGCNVFLQCHTDLDYTMSIALVHL
jgi:hypothetical protein